jgi:hypothetical protein
MGERGEETLPAAVEHVRMGLAQWRGRRRRGERIPEELWDAAARAGREYGVCRVSRALGLDYGSLKRRVGDGSGDALFVELAGPRPGAEAPAGCVVELEKGNGARLRVCVRDAATVDWCRVKEAFLGA